MLVCECVCWREVPAGMCDRRGHVAWGVHRMYEAALCCAGGGIIM